MTAEPSPRHRTVARRPLADYAVDDGPPPPEPDDWNRSTAPTPRDGSGIRLLTIDELADLKPPTWRIENILPDAAFATIFGVQSTYKSFVALDWGLSISTGIPWFGHATTAGIVVYVAAEGGTGIAKRIKAWQTAHDHDHALLAAGFRAVPHAVNLRDTATVDGLHHALIDQLDASPDLLIIDTWSRSMPGGNENAAEEVSAAIDRLDRIRLDLDCGMLIVHHAGLEGGRERGSSSLPYAMDCRWETDGTPNAESITLRNHKQKDWEPTPPIGLRRHIVGDGDEASIVLGPDSDPCSRHHPVVSALDRAGELPQNKVVMRLTGTKEARVKAAQDTAACERCPVESWKSGQKKMYRRSDQTHDEPLKVQS